MSDVVNILKAKGNTTVSVSPSITVYEALTLMVNKNIGALLVAENDKLSGLFTERDYARKIILQGKSSKETLVGEVMLKDPITVSPETTIADCMWIMTNKFTRYLPVVKDDKLLGIISIGDVVKYTIDEQKFIIENLEHYIKGS